MCQVTHKSKSPLIRVASPTCRAYSTYTPATQHAYICTNAIHSPANRIANKLDNLGNTVTSPTISYPSVNFYKGAEKRSSGVTSPIYMQKMAHTIGS